jgi:hypothetical protein
MSSANIEIVFEGPGVEGGTIDARLLADSLTGYSDVFRRVNYIVNGEGSEATVLVQANFKPGSFIAELQFVQDFLQQANQFIVTHRALNAAELTALIRLIWKYRETLGESLIDLYKWLKGKKPDKTMQLGNSLVELSVGNNKKTVNNIVVECYGDNAVRAAMSRLVSPLRAGAINRISVKQDGVEQTSIEKAEIPYFEPEPTALLTQAELPMEGERDTVLVVSKLSFTEGSTWTFFERGATVVAKITDQEFWQQVHDHKVTFGEGDMLRVRLAWKIEKLKKLTQKNVITKVHDVLPRPRQMRLDGGNDDEMR